MLRSLYRAFRTRMRAALRLAAWPRPRPRYNSHLVVLTRHNNLNALREWIEYHLAIGFDAITIFDNDSLIDIAPLARQYRKVQSYRISGFPDQNGLYTRFINNSETSRWIMYLDDDEYLYFNQSFADVNSMLNHYEARYPKLKCLSVWWKLISSNAFIHKHTDGYIDYFTYIRPDPEKYSHVKSLTHRFGSTAINYPDPHLPFLDNRPQGIMFDGSHVLEPYRESVNVLTHDLRIYHYHHRSYQDWHWKCTRGNASTHVPELQRSLDTEEQFASILKTYVIEDLTMVNAKKRFGMHGSQEKMAS